MTLELSGQLSQTLSFFSIVRETTVGIALFPTERVQGDGAGKPSIISRTMLRYERLLFGPLNVRDPAARQPPT